MAADPRAELLAYSLVAWQWPDGGWNCDLGASGRRSSFHESLAPAWGLHEYGLATGATWAQQGAARAAEQAAATIARPILGGSDTTSTGAPGSDAAKTGDAPHSRKEVRGEVPGELGGGGGI
jgi:hypothetical protein